MKIWIFQEQARAAKQLNDRAEEGDNEHAVDRDGGIILI